MEPGEELAPVSVRQHESRMKSLRIEPEALLLEASV
jgi:hypothetical protein